MATLGPVDADFSSLVTWEASLPATLTAVATLDCTDFALEEAAGCVLDSVTSADFYYDIHTSGGSRPGRAPRTVSGAGFSYSSSNVSGTIRFGNDTNHVRFDGVELIGTGSATPIAWPGTVAVGSDHRLENCILHDELTGTGNTIPASKANLNLTLRNTIVFGYRRTIDTRSAASVLSENNTFWRHANQLGVVSDSELTCKNTYSGHVGALEAFWTGSAPPTGNNNATSDAAIPDYTSSLTSIAGADVFVSVTPGSEDFTLKAGTNPLVDAGATLATVTTDITGLARPQGGAYDIGAAERAAAGTDLNLTTIFTPADAAGNTAAVDLQRSITTTLGTADASGLTAAIDIQKHINAELGTAVASGYAVNIDLQQTISSIFSPASASGFAADVDLQQSLVSIFSPAVASGNDANINLTREISATLVTADAIGYDADVQLAGSLNITTISGIASAFGSSANVDLQYIIATTPGTASSIGYQASIDFATSLNIAAILGTASASGFASNIDRQIDISCELAMADATGYLATVDLVPFAPIDWSAVDSGFNTYSVSSDYAIMEISHEFNIYQIEV